MSSPFKTHQEFLEAKGPIYSFGNSPAIVGVLLVLSAIVLLWFIYASYTIRNGKSNAKNPVVLSLIIATSAFSLAESVYTSRVEKMNNTSSKKEGVQERVTSSRGQGLQVPIAVAGMTVASSSIIQRRSRKKTLRSFQNPNSIWGSLLHRMRTGLSLMLRSTRTPVVYRSKHRSR